MIACQKTNQDDNLIVYGIVSTGMIWEFCKLMQNTFTKHPFSYSIVEPQKVLGVCENQKWQILEILPSHFMAPKPNCSK